MADISESIVNIFSPVTNVIISTYLFFRDSFAFLDTPGTYIMWIVIGLIYVPFFTKNVYDQYANPHGYYVIPLVRKTVMGIIFITAWLVFGYANFIRFLP